MAELEAKLETKMEAAEAGKGSLYLGDAIEFFLRSKRSGGRSEKTVNDYRKKLELFQRWVSGQDYDVSLEQADADAIEAYVVYLKDGRSMADSSRKNHLDVLRSFFKTVSKRLKVPDPSAELDEVRFYQKVPSRSFLTKREADLLLAAIDEKKPLGARDHALFSTMLYAGLRIEEVTNLEVEDLRLSCGEEEIRVAYGKGSKERRIPVNEKLRRSLRRYLRVRDKLIPAQSGSPLPHLFLNNKGGRVSENTVRRTLYKYVRKSGIRKTDVKPHDLRRTFATWFLQENPDQARELAELMGHSDLSQVMKYALSDEKRARAGVAKL